MQLRRLGRTNLMVSCIGLGGMGFINRTNKHRLNFNKVINTALDAGINFIDTARSYYDSENIIGEAIKERRRECILATKTYLRSYRGAIKEIELSLKNLQTNRIDLYQLHHIQYEYELKSVLSKDGALRALKEAKSADKIDYIGVSSHRPDMVIECMKTNEFDTVQVPLNPIEKEHIEEILNLAKQMDIGIIIMKPLAGGNLSNVKAALKFVLNYDVSTVIAGCSTVEQVKIDAQIGKDFINLSEQERLELAREIDDLEKTFCRRCKYCEPLCPAQIPISDIFRCEDYLRLNATYARDEYRRLSINGKRCIDCKKCEDICPYRLPIRNMLKRATARLSKGKLEDAIIHWLRDMRLYDVVRNIYFNLKLPIPKR